MKKNRILNKIKALNLILILLLFVFTIFQIGVLTNQVYFISQAKKKINQLSKENQFLEEQFFNSNSLSNLDDFIKKENLVKVEKMKFIQIFQGAVLAK